MREPHDLLPWYVNGTLRPEEAARFREHLAQCPSCRDDLSWVEQMKGELGRHSEALLQDHPDADALVDVAHGEARAEEAARIRRHLALCATCELESRWIAGDAIPGGVPGHPSAPALWAAGKTWGGWIAAAALLAFAVVLPALRRPVQAPPGPYRPAVVAPDLRSAEAANRFSLAPGDAGLQLILEADIAPGAFPLEVAIVDASGRTVHRRSGIGREYLANGLSLIVTCERSACAPGVYVARLTGADATTLEYAFEVAER